MLCSVGGHPASTIKVVIISYLSNITSQPVTTGMLECQNLCERREAYLSTCGVSALQEMKSQVWPDREQQSKSLPGMFKNSRLIILWWTLVVTKLGIYSFNLKHTNNEKIVKKHFYKDPFKQNSLKLLKPEARSLRWYGMKITKDFNVTELINNLIFKRLRRLFWRLE